jgi:hypothetical protein
MRGIDRLLLKSSRLCKQVGAGATLSTLKLPKIIIKMLKTCLENSMEAQQDLRESC